MKYKNLGFITTEEILELVGELSPNHLERVVDMVNNVSPFISFPYTKKESVETEESFTSELKVEYDQKVFTRVEENIYTESREFFHIVQSHLQNLTISDYLDNLLIQIKENERLVQEQIKKHGQVEDGRINNE